MKIIYPLAFAVGLISLSGCGGGNSSTPTSPTGANTPASIAPSLAAEINSSFLAALRAGGPVASTDHGASKSLFARMLASLVGVPVSAQSGFVGACSKGGTVRIQTGVSAPGGGQVRLTNSEVIYSNCAHALSGGDIVANGTLTGNGTWTSTTPSSPVRLVGNLTVNEVGIVAIDGSTGSTFNGSIGGVTVGTPTPAPTPTPTPTPAPTPTPTPTPAPTPVPLSLTGRWIGVAPDGVIITAPDSCDSEQDLTLDLTQTGNTFSGTATDRPRAFHPAVCSAPTTGKTNTLSGTVEAGTFSFTSPGERGRVITCSGTFTATRLTASCEGGVMTIAVNRQ